MYGRIIEAQIQLEHRHSDGTWGRFERAHHDATEHDPERDWATGMIVYSCRTCDELVRVTDPNQPGSKPEAG
jgi:hypothetical protein